MTYPEPAVAKAINENFVPIQINVKDESSQPLVERYRQSWTPDLRLLDSDGAELCRWNGYLPPYEFLPQLFADEFLPQLFAAQAQAQMRLQNNTAAAEIYDYLLRRFPTSAIAPEAQYFYAVAKYKVSGEGPDLLGNWWRLQMRYLDSVWRVKQSFAENA